MNKLVFAIAIVALACILSAPVGAQHHDHNRGDDMAAASAFASIISHYEAIHAALAGDSIKGITEHAEEIQEIADNTSKDFRAAIAGISEENAKVCRELLPEVAKAAGTLAAAKDISSARVAFGDLSRPLVRYRNIATGEEPKVAYCPMVKKPWLQAGDTIENPYYGSSMLRCGEFVVQ